MCESRSKELSGDTNLPITWPLSEQPRWMQCEASRASGSLPSSFQSGQKRNELWIPPSFKVLKQGHRFLSLQSALADRILSHGLKRGPIKLTPSWLPKSEDLFLEHLMERASDGASLWLQLGRLPLDSLEFSIPNFLVELPNTTLSPTVTCHRPKNRTKNTNFESLSPKETKKKTKRKKRSMPSTSQPSAYQMLWILELWEGGGTCRVRTLSALPLPSSRSTRSSRSKPHWETPKPQEETERPQKLRSLPTPQSIRSTWPAHQDAAAAAKSLQSCPTLCDPTDGSPPGSPVPGILQARTLEWVAISFSSAWKWKVKVKSLSRVRLFETPWTAAHQAPPSLGFSR